jgi:hypothetical protein
MNKQTKRDIIGAVSATLTFVLVVSLLAWVATAEASENLVDGMRAAAFQDYQQAHTVCENSLLQGLIDSDAASGSTTYYQCMATVYMRKLEMVMELKADEDEGVRM